MNRKKLLGLVSWAAVGLMLAWGGEVRAAPQANALQAGDEFVVAAPGARLMRGYSTVAVLPQGLKLRALKAEGRWVGTTVSVNGRNVSGWVWADQIAAQRPGAAINTAPRGSDAAEQGAPAESSKQPEAAAKQAQQSQEATANRWRYSFHNGHWWYYRDGGRWAYWTGKEWRDYDRLSYVEWYARQKTAGYNAELARFDARVMQPYLSDSFPSGYYGWGTLSYRPQTTYYGIAPRSWGAGSRSNGLFYPRPFSGRLNYATSVGGYMGSALSSPYGY